MWELTSLRYIKNIHELKLNIIKTGTNTKDEPKNGTIQNKNNSFVINVDENLAKYVLTLEEVNNIYAQAEYKESRFIMRR